jgi:hypothetical protein
MKATGESCAELGSDGTEDACLGASEEFNGNATQRITSRLPCTLLC